MDANATTPLLPEVVEAMRPYWMEHFGNASSIHLHGQQARTAIDRARETMAEFFNCHDAEVVLTPAAPKETIPPSSAFCIPAITSSPRRLSTPPSWKVRSGSRSTAWRRLLLPRQPSGLIDPTDILRAVRPQTRLISVMLANNETGVLQPVEEIGRIAADTGIFLPHRRSPGRRQDKDRCAQNWLPSALHQRTQDARPKGVGAMFVRRGTPVESLLVGGSHERRRRAGTENVAGIVGLAKAAELAMHSLADGSIDRLAKLRDRLETEILRIPGTGLNGAQLPQNPGAPGPAFGIWESTELVPVWPTPQTSGLTI